MKTPVRAYKGINVGLEKIKGSDTQLRYGSYKKVEIFEWWKMKTMSKQVECRELGYFKWWVIGDEWWVMKIEWWNKKKKSKQTASLCRHQVNVAIFFPFYYYLWFDNWERWISTMNVPIRNIKRCQFNYKIFTISASNSTNLYYHFCLMLHKCEIMIPFLFID